MENLPEEVRKRIEENRAKALAIKKQKEAERLQAAQNSARTPATTTSAASFFGKPQATTPAVNAFSKPFTDSGAGRGRGYRGGGSYDGPNVHAGKPDSTGYYNNNVYNRNSNQAKPTTVAKKTAKPSGVSGLCILISRTEFLLQCGYDAKLTEVLRTFPGSRFVPTSRHYAFPVGSMETLVKKIRDEVPDVSVTSLPSFIPKILRLNTRIPLDDIELSSIDPKLRKALMPFQREGILRAISQRGRVLIADDMGLGKTVQALAIVTYFREEWPLLVVCPSSMRFAWRDAFLRWLPSVIEHDIQVIVKSSEPLGGSPIIITSYDLVSRRSADLLAHKFKVLIFDESHFLKGCRTQRTKVATELSAQARRIVLLSGTPALSRPIELFPQIQCLAVRGWPVVHDFAVRYCNARETKFGWDYSGSSYLDELNILLQEVIMIRRLKSEVLDQLPDKQRTVILLDPTLVQRQDRQAEHLSQMVNDSQLSSTERRGILLQYFAKSAEIKKVAVCKYVEDMLEGDVKFLVFAHHKVMLDAVSELLIQKKIDYIRIDGKVGSEARQKLVDHFQSSEKCRVAVLSITAANAGITLHTANLVIFAELFWNPGILTQAEDRVHRIGQKQNCLIQYLVARDSSDDYIWPLIEQKLCVLNQVGLTKDSFSDAMDRVSEQVVSEPESSTSTRRADEAPPRKRQKSIVDFMNATNDSFWEEMSQDTSVVGEG